MISFLTIWNIKLSQAHAMMNAKKVILEVAAEYEKLTGRKYGLFEEYKLDDAEVAIVVINSTAGTAKAAIEEMRKEGKKSWTSKNQSI